MLYQVRGRGVNGFLTSKDVGQIKLNGARAIQRLGCWRLDPSRAQDAPSRLISAPGLGSGGVILKPGNILIARGVVRIRNVGIKRYCGA